MLIPTWAIERAIEGGWAVELHPMTREACPIGDDGKYGLPLTESEIALDPSFWQALGKVLGWDTDRYKGGAKDYAYSREYYWMWQAKAHHLYHLILTNQSTDAFWEELKPKGI